MKIVVDALGLPRFGGARSSAIGWLAALAEHSPQHRYTVFLSRCEYELSPFPNVEQRFAPVRNRFLVRLWAQATLPAFLRQSRADLFHAFKNLTIFGAPCPTIVTVNDLTHLLLPEYYPLPDNLFWRYVQPSLLRRAARVIAISDDTRQGLLDRYGLDPVKVKRIYPSYHPKYEEPAGPCDAARFCHGLPDAYILYVGGLGLHKNVGTLVRAFKRIADQIEHSLVLVGGAYHTSSDRGLAAELARGEEDGRILLLDKAPDEDMPAIYQMADLFVLPSLNEGFGLTLLEAMVSGVPVIASPRGAMCEVVGDAGLMLPDITDDAALAEAMLRLLRSPEQRHALSEKGRLQATRFSWAETARQTLALYDEVVAGDSSGGR